MDRAECIACAREVLRIEAKTLGDLEARIGESFAQAVELILDCKGRVVVTGMGKAGLVGRKIQATLASTGTPSIFLHPVEAIHGDLGMVLAADIVLALSNSGESDEIVRLVPHIKKIGARIIAVSASAASTLGRHSDVVLEIGHIEEACPLKLAPSASTTALMALGDALALTLQKARNFTAEEYARFHPGGELGRKLLRVSEVMRTGERCPVAHEGEPVGEVIGRLTRAQAGCVAVTDARDRLRGVFTDGDFRRLCANGLIAQSFTHPVNEFMSAEPQRIGPESLVAEAMGIFQDKKINALPVVDGEDRVLGLLDVQDIVGLRIDS